MATAYTGPTGAAAEANYTRYQMGGIDAPIAVPEYTPGGAYAGALYAQAPPAASPNVQPVTVTAAAPGGQAMSWGTGGTSPWNTAAYSPASSPAQIAAPNISPNITPELVGATPPSLTPPAQSPGVEQANWNYQSPTPQQVATPALSPYGLSPAALRQLEQTPTLTPNGLPVGGSPGAGAAASGSKPSSGSSGGSSGGGSGPQPQQQQPKPTTNPITINNIVGRPVSPTGQVGQSPGGGQAGYAPSAYAAGGSPAGGILGNMFSGGNMNLVLGLLFGAALLYAASESQ